MPDPAIGSADYELLWPRELFARELTALSSICQDNHPNEWIELLFEEAFLGDTPVRDYKCFHGPWGRVHVEQLLAHVSLLREHHVPSPYWSIRHGGATGIPCRGPAQLRGDFARLISSLHIHGYFNHALPKLHVDDLNGVEPDLEALLADRLGVSGLWPLQSKNWSDDVFYDLVEVFHDFVARPRTRNGNRNSLRGYRYGEFVTDIGRALYRWKVNTLLESSGVEFRLALNGEDVGRIVHFVADARTDLVARALSTPDLRVADRVAHAITLFRRRSATEHDKRSAIVALALVLEERRALLKKELFRKDEGALFDIANNFDLRHRDEKQHADYDPTFRDWVFWWYLATIELTDRLLARPEQQTSPAAAGSTT